MKKLCVIVAVVALSAGGLWAAPWFTDVTAQVGLEARGPASWADYDNDGWVDVCSGQILFHNENGKRFVRTGEYGGIWGDCDNDGDLDLLTGGKLYENRVASGHWLKVRLEGPGSAIGAQVRIQLPRGEKPLARQVLTRQVESSGAGEGSQSELTLHFGLGDHSGPVLLEIS